MPKETLKQADADVRPVVDPDALATPEEHAKAEKQFAGRVVRFARIGNQSPTFDMYSWQHNAAAALHGWGDHAHHAGKPMQLTAKAYRNALRAAANPDVKGNYVPEPAALSPHCPHTRKS